MNWKLDLQRINRYAQSEDARWELAYQSDGTVLINFYNRHGSLFDVQVASDYAQKG